MERSKTTQPDSHAGTTSTPSPAELLDKNSESPPKESPTLDSSEDRLRPREVSISTTASNDLFATHNGSLISSLSSTPIMQSATDNTIRSPDELQKRGSQLSVSHLAEPVFPGRPISASEKSIIAPSTLGIAAVTNFSTQRVIKYATGKYAGVELVPQPSDEPNDPLNWPQWRKEINFVALLLCQAVVACEKTLYMTVTGELARLYNVSFTSAATLTGIPLMLSAVVAVVASIASRFVGKRPLYLAGVGLLLVGSLLGLCARRGFALNMTARLLQALAWGAFDTLVLGSIYDTFFEHQRKLRIAVHALVTLTTTWGPPVLGGFISGQGDYFERQYVLLAPFVVLAAAAVAIGCPETAFDRSAIRPSTVNKYSAVPLPLPPLPPRAGPLSAVVSPSSLSSSSTAFERLSSTSRSTSSTVQLNKPHPPLPPSSRWCCRSNAVESRGLRPYFSIAFVTSAMRAQLPLLGAWTYRARLDTLGQCCRSLMLQAPLALIAPTTLLLFLGTGLPLCAVWGLSVSFPLLFRAAPFHLQPADVSVVLLVPFLLAGLVAVVTNLPVSTAPAFAPKISVRFLAMYFFLGSAACFAGSIAMGCYVFVHVDVDSEGRAVPFAMLSAAQRATRAHDPLSFGILGLLLGMVTAGNVLVDGATKSPLVKHSTDYTGRNLTIANRITVDMEGGVVIWRSLFAGVFVLTVPETVESFREFRMTCVGLGITTLVIAAIVGGLWYLCGDEVRGMDGRVMRLVDWSMLRSRSDSPTDDVV